MALFDGVVEDSAACIVLLERTRPLLKQQTDDFRVAAPSRIDERCAAFGARLVDVGLPARQQRLHELKVALDRRAIERRETPMVARVDLKRFGQVARYR